MVPVLLWEPSVLSPRARGRLADASIPWSTVRMAGLRVRVPRTHRLWIIPPADHLLPASPVQTTTTVSFLLRAICRRVKPDPPPPLPNRNHLLHSAPSASPIENQRHSRANFSGIGEENSQLSSVNLSPAGSVAGFWQHHPSRPSRRADANSLHPPLNPATRGRRSSPLSLLERTGTAGTLTSSPLFGSNPLTKTPLAERLHRPRLPPPTKLRRPHFPLSLAPNCSLSSLSELRRRTEGSL